jgi:hypothetical protein
MAIFIEGGTGEIQRPAGRQRPQRPQRPQMRRGKAGLLAARGPLDIEPRTCHTYPHMYIWLVVWNIFFPSIVGMMIQSD